jgi:ADP-ribose pyrophosphatase YjhB (NUDIX family)
VEEVITRLTGIRTVAICVFHRDGRILVAPGFDDVKNERFFRPLGGAVEFGELAVEAVRREIREELGVEIDNPVQLGIIENRFEYRGQPGHEVVFVFDASFPDRRIYGQRTVPIQEPGWDGPAEWIALDDPFAIPLYPAGLDNLLRRVR